MLAESVPWTFCQNNTMMLTCMHNHAPEILLWRCSCHRNKKQNSRSSFNYMNCMKSLAVTSSTLKTSVKFWDTSFKFWLCLWIWHLAFTWVQFASNNLEFFVSCNIKISRTLSFCSVFCYVLLYKKTNCSPSWW